MDVHETAGLERVVVVRTPENLELTFQLAGAGTRSAAYVLDILLMWLAMMLLQNLFAAIITSFGPDFMPYGMAILGGLTFLVAYAYFIVFEWLWGGQTPGKRIVGIRVVKTGGYALTFLDTLLRNLLRVVDFLPVMYAVGLVSLVLTRNCQRLGDLVAGTLVVYEQRIESMKEIPQSRSPAAEPLTLLQVASVPPDVVETCDEFFRAAPDLAPRARQELADSLIDLVHRTSGLTPSASQSSEAFLASIIRSGEQTPLAST